MEMEMDAKRKYLGANLLPVFKHKFISYHQALEVYRALQVGTHRLYNPNEYPMLEQGLPFCRDIALTITTLGKNISLEDRFPDGEIYYDLDESMLGLILKDIVEKHKYQLFGSNEYEQFKSEIFKVVTIQPADDPLRGVYTRQSFEKKFGLCFTGTHYTLMSKSS